LDARGIESRTIMRLLAVAVAAVLAAGAVSSAQAQQQPRPKRLAANPPGTYVMHRDEDGKVRTKILVQKRSYLDGGTEVMPGDNIDPYRSSFLMHRPSAVTTNTAFDRPSWVNDPFFLPGKRNPYPFGGD
jgi:hypothetical protein